MRHLSLVALILTVSSGSAGADTIDLMEFFGVNHSVDLAIEKLQGLEDHAQALAIGVELKTNADVEARIDQVNGVINDSVKQLRSLVQEANGDINAVADKMVAAINSDIADLSKLESKFFTDLESQIQNVYCKSVSFTQVIKDLCGTVCELIGGYQIKITAPVMYAGEERNFCIKAFEDCRVTQTFAIREPFSQTYEEIKAYLEGRLSGARDNTPVQSIIDTYGYLSELAARSECDLEAQRPFYDAQTMHYKELARQWEIVVLGKE